MDQTEAGVVPSTENVTNWLLLSLSHPNDLT